MRGGRMAGRYPLAASISLPAILVCPGSISVIIPAYNAARYLPEAIASAQGQTRQPIEIIVVDDGSSDESGAVAAGAGAHVVRMRTNSGPSAARNAAIRETSGAYVAMLDADDQWEPNHCETVGGLLDLHVGAALANSRARLIAPAVGETPVWVESDRPLEMFARMLRANPVVQTTAIVRRDALMDAGGYDTALRYAEDYDLWLRLARSRTFVFTDAVTARYRVHDQQASRNSPELATGAWIVRRRHFDWLAGQNDPETTDAASSDLRAALDDELRWAWNANDRHAMEAMLDATVWLPGVDRVERRWRQRLGIAGPVWRLAGALRRTVGRGVRRYRG